ncbi:hypothetical protein JTE90_028657 [Oedothorax gibbosus]|uniref:C2 domain-containing protein n=1 Tax=Oedothorax gibbosus TaxID=931172 RepID=A0AAV6UZK0_9ARAC|nr:hypothetical protein JTE90_028657 [Oedothorax gibbosus]
MSLLCVTVKRAALVGTANQFNTYVTLKLQNVKSTTTSVKGNEPAWESDFIFETNRMDIGLIIEVWNKGMLWDKLLGLQWMPLTRIKYTNEGGEGQWLSLDQELMMEEGEVVGTKVPTGHSLLLEAHFELPCEDLEDEELMKKLDYLNVILGHEISSLREQDRRHNFSLNSGISEDSDYTSDVSYPTQVQHPSASVHHPNSSAHQFGGAAEITRRAAAASQYPRPKYIEPGNSYETDYETSRDRNEYTDRNSVSEDPLYYNSRPNRRMNSHSTDRSRSTRSTSGYDNSLSLDYESDMRYSFETDRSSRHCHFEEDTIDTETDKKMLERFQSSNRRRSLERQTGFDESVHDKFVAQHANSAEDYGYRESPETYPQSSFESYPSFREDSVSTENWEKSSKYNYNEPDAYYMPQWNGEPEPVPVPVPVPVKPASTKYKQEETLTDWSKVNGAVPGRGTGRKLPDPEEWRNDSTGSEWKKRSLESEWSKEHEEWKESPTTDWGHDTGPTIEVPKVPVRKAVPTIPEIIPPVPVKVADRWGGLPTEPVKDPDRWNKHPPEPAKDPDRWNKHPPEPTKDDRWNKQLPEPTKDPDRWTGHPAQVPKVADHWNGPVAEAAMEPNRWNGQPVEIAKAAPDRWKEPTVETPKDKWNGQPPAEPTTTSELWNNKTLDTAKAPVERRNSHVAAPVKNGEQWNGHSAEVKKGDRWNNHPVEVKNGDRWNGTEPSKKEDKWDSNVPTEPVRNAERWKTHADSIKNGWSEETIVQEDWADDAMTNHQIDSLINEWQDDTEEPEWMVEEEEEEEEEEMDYEKEPPKPDFPEIQVKEPPPAPIPIIEKEPESDFKSQVTNSIEFETSLTLTVDKSEADIARDRRASVLSTKGLAPSLDVPSIDFSGAIMFPSEPVVPTLPIDEADPTMSRAKRRWINAFNKIVAQLNEVRPNICN